MITGIDSYINYFKAFADNHVALDGSFVVGDANRVIGQQRAELNYPCLWLETPSVRFTERGAEGNTWATYEGAFVILHNAADTSYDEQNALRQSTLMICEDILRKIIWDAENNQFDTDAAIATCDPISTFMVDNDYGWRVAINISALWDNADQPNRWNS